MVRIGRVFLLMSTVATGLMTASSAFARDDVRVFMMRGFLDVSTGLDDLAVKLKRQAIPADVTTYIAESDVASAALRYYKLKPGRKIVLVGHSLGANAAVNVARELQNANVPVALLVAFSPADSKAVPGNVARAIDYYQSNSTAFNTPYSRGVGFSGTLRNIDLAKDANIHHLNIEKSPRLHAETIRQITSLANTQSALVERQTAATAAGQRK